MILDEFLLISDSDQEQRGPMEPIEYPAVRYPSFSVHSSCRKAGMRDLGAVLLLIPFSMASYYFYLYHEN